ncbi:MAG: hypothetical protein LBU40_01650 [Methanobrevibacter sp.]|jgi:hypothetical protein|nr:hypothetical protein [Methanobrevibacter sp.]
MTKTKNSQKSHKIKNKRKFKKKNRNFEYSAVNNKLRKVKNLIFKLNDKINLINDEGVNENIYHESFRIVNQIKYYIDLFYTYKMSRGQTLRYYTLLSMFKSKYTYFKNITYEFYIKLHEKNSNPIKLLNKL